MSILEKIQRLKSTQQGNIAVQSFDAEFYDTLNTENKARLLKCINSGIENPDSEMGCYANQPTDYDDLRPFFEKVLSKFHRVAEGTKHINSWELNAIDGLPGDGNLDLSVFGLPSLSMRVRVGRNLADFPLPGAMSREQRVALEVQMMGAFEQLMNMSEYGGAYYSLTPGNPNFIDQEQYQELVDAHIMFKNMDDDTYLTAAGIASDWPYGRGCYVSSDKGFIIWVGEEDHLRIMCMNNGTVLNTVFDRLKTAIDVVENIDGLNFAKSNDFGFVTSCPTNLGTAMRASLHIQLPNLTADGTDRKAKEVARPLGLAVRGTGGEHTPIGADGTVDISPRARFCITEGEIIAALYKGVKLLKQEEDAAAAS